MKRSLFIAIVVLLMAALFVSCNADKAMEDQLFEVTIDGGARALSATGTQDVDVEELFWYFSATKASGLFRTGETEWKAVKDIAGISGASLGPFSKGSWTFSFYGFTSAQAEKPADPATAAVYYQTGLAQDISQAVALTLSLTKGVLPAATIEFTEGGITWTYAAGGANLTLEMEILEGTTAIEFEDNVTRLPGEYDATSGSYVFTLDDAMELTEGEHAFTVNVYNIDGQDEELVGQAEITITAVNGMRYVVSGSVEITDELNEVTIVGADAPVTAQAPVIIEETGKTDVVVANAPAAGKTTTVSFPEGALTEDTNLTVETASAEAIPANTFQVNAGEEVKAAISLSLDGVTSFNGKTVTVTTFIEPNLNGVNVYYNGTDEQPTLVEYIASTGKLVFTTTHFSEFYVTTFTAAPEIQFSTTAVSESSALLDFMKANVYNKYTEAKWNQQETHECSDTGHWRWSEITGENKPAYFVKVGTISSGAVSSVAFDDCMTYSSDSAFNLSIGNNNFINEKAWYVDGNELYVAAPVFILNTAVDGNIIINGVRYDTGISTANTLDVTEFKAGSTVVEATNDGTYVLDGKMAKNDRIFVTIDSEESTDLLFTKKVNNDDGQLSVNYGFTSADAIGSAYGVWLYYFGWNKDPYNRNLDYSIYVIGKGIVTVRCTYELSTISGTGESGTGSLDGDGF